jgi:hypothetical protein
MFRAMFLTSLRGPGQCPGCTFNKAWGAGAMSGRCLQLGSGVCPDGSLTRCPGCIPGSSGIDPGSVFNQASGSGPMSGLCSGGAPGQVRAIPLTKLGGRAVSGLCSGLCSGGDRCMSGHHSGRGSGRCGRFGLYT